MEPVNDAFVGSAVLIAVWRCGSYTIMVIP